MYTHVYIVHHFVLSLFVQYVLRTYLNVQIFNNFKLKFSKAMCVSLLDRGREEIGTKLNELKRPKGRETQDFIREE